MSTMESNLLDDFLTEEQLAAELGRCRDTIKGWRRLGEAPPHTRIGRTIYYRKDSVREWLKSRQVEAA